MPIELPREPNSFSEKTFYTGVENGHFSSRPDDLFLRGFLFKRIENTYFFQGKIFLEDVLGNSSRMGGPSYVASEFKREETIADPGRVI
jgi:hypothetical protein